MTKEELFNYCFNGHESPVSIRMRWYNIKCHPDIYEYLINYFEDADDTNSSAPEILYRIIHDIKVKPKCPICGKPSSFKRFDRGYGIFCSEECRRSKEGELMVRKKTTETFLEKYGYKCASQNEAIIEKMISTNNERYGGNSPSNSKVITQKQIETKRIKYGEHLEKVTEKVKLTNLERYGVEFSALNPDILQKMINTYKGKYGALFNPEKSKETCLEKYGTEIYAASEDIKEKRKASLLKNYGVEYSMQSDIIKEKQKITMKEKYGYDHNFKIPGFIEKMKSNEIREKQWETKKKNGTTNSSKIEELFAKYLIDNNYKFERNYANDERYPYHADFYLEDFDLFIEILGSWVHGGHPFDENNLKDIERLNYMNDKNTSYYNNAIIVWTIRDVEKRKIAKENNLNYLELFSCNINECIKLFEQIICK